MDKPIFIVGGGLAGLYCALKLAPRKVTLLTAAPLGDGASTAWAQGGIAAAVSEGDTPESHAHDTVVAGAGIVDEARALSMVREASERVRDLLKYGVPFDRDLEGHLLVSREAAHSTRRIVRVKGDQAGAAIIAALSDAVLKTPSIKVLTGFMTEELLAENGRVNGLRARNLATGEITNFPASAIVLATGGIGALYAVTTNPAQARGTGIAMAARAGAVIADAEFVQFHPTAIDIGRDPAPLATEALRGDGATLVNRNGERFMQAVHKDAELAARDIVARAVFAEIQAGRGAFIDARKALGEKFAEKFPGVYAVCRSAGIDPAKDLIPIAPAEHYHMGGIAVDERGRSSLEGLWAAGEVASTGVHGANRLASNSLLEAVVYGGRVADDIASAELRAPGFAQTAVRAIAPSVSPRERELRALMASNVGVVRDGEDLAQALAVISDIEEDATTLSQRNLATVALMITAAAYDRRESRGGHFRSDYPSPDPAKAKRSMLTLADARRIADAAVSGAHMIAAE